MMRLGWWIPVVASLYILWQECGENLAPFCYRVGVTLYACARFGEFHPSGAARRVLLACSNPSFTSFVPSTTQKGSNS